MLKLSWLRTLQLSQNFLLLAPRIIQRAQFRDLLFYYYPIRNISYVRVKTRVPANNFVSNIALRCDASATVKGLNTDTGEPLSAFDLSRTLQVDLKSFLRYYRKHKELQSITPATLKARLFELERKGVMMNRIQYLPWLIMYEPGKFDKKVNLVKGILQCGFECAVPFVNFSEAELQKIVTKWGQENYCIRQEGKLTDRMSFLMDSLKLSKTDVAYMMGRVPALTMKPGMEKLYDVIQLLKEAEVQPEHVYLDPWIFHHSLKVMRKRFEGVKELNISPIRPWMLRADALKFSAFSARILQETQILKGNPDIVSFLENEMQFSRVDVERMLRACPEIDHCLVVKIRDKINFLLSLGYNRQDIVNSPWMLRHTNLGTLKSRHSELLELGIERPSLTSMFLSRKCYDELVERIGAKKYVQATAVKQPVLRAIKPKRSPTLKKSRISIKSV